MKANRLQFRVLYLFLAILGHGCGNSQSSSILEDVEPKITVFDYSDDYPPVVSAHRGGRNIPAYPENAIETFEYVFDLTNCIIECDISLSKDSILFLMHDETINRTTNGFGKGSDLTWAQLSDYRLVDDFGELTNFGIPRLSEVLKWGKENMVFFTLDIKAGVPFEAIIQEVHEFAMHNQVAMIHILPLRRKKSILWIPK